MDMILSVWGLNFIINQNLVDIFNFYFIFNFENSEPYRKDMGVQVCIYNKYLECRIWFKTMFSVVFSNWRIYSCHDDVIKWRHFPRYWPFVRGIHRGFPAQRPVTRIFDVFCDLRLNKRLSKQSWGWWFETLLRTLWRHHNGNDLFSST